MTLGRKVKQGPKVLPAHRVLLVRKVLLEPKDIYINAFISLLDYHMEVVVAPNGEPSNDTPSKKRTLTEEEAVENLPAILNRHYKLLYFNYPLVYNEHFSTKEAMGRLINETLTSLGWIKFKEVVDPKISFSHW